MNDAGRGAAVSHVPAPRVLVVVPALNEESSIGSVIDGIRSHAPDADVLVVDDHSADDTSARAARHGAALIRLPFTLGVGGAMRTGYVYASRNRYDVVVQVDGDGQHDPQHLPELIAGLKAADVVIGARFADTHGYQVGPARRFVMIVLAKMMSWIIGTRLTDTTSGYRAVGSRAIALFAEHYPAEYLGDTLEALIIAKRCGLVVAQVPVRMTAREHGRPSQGIVGSVTYLLRALAAIGLGLVRRWPAPSTQGAAP